MDVFRRYFSDAQLRTLAASEPNWGVNLVTVGHSLHKPDVDYPDPDHPGSHVFDWDHGRTLGEYQLVYVVNGRGVYEGEARQPIEVLPGTILILSPGVWHRYRPRRDTGWEEYWVGFTGHYAQYLMQQECFRSTDPLVGDGFGTEVLQVFTRLLTVVREERLAYRQLSSCLIIQLLGLVYSSALMAKPNKVRGEQIVHELCLHLHEHWTEKLDLRKYALQRNVGYEWLRKLFKQLTHTSPGRYLANIQLENAKSLLSNPELTVAGVAAKCGYNSEFYFSRAFKRKYGESPSFYRKRL